MHRSAILACLNGKNSKGEATLNAISLYECLPEPLLAEGQFAYKESRLGQNALCEIPIVRWIDGVQWCSENGDRLAMCVKCSSVCCPINTFSESTHDSAVTSRQFVC